MPICKLIIEDIFRLYFAAIKNHIMVFGLVFQRITVGTSQKKIGPIKFAVYIAAMGPQMLNFNSVWREISQR